MEKHLIRTILIIMSSIGQVEYRMHDNFIGIYKEGILFAKVYTENLYLLNNQGIFVRIDNEEKDIQDKLKHAYNIALAVAWAKNKELDYLEYKFFFLSFPKNELKPKNNQT